MKRIIIIGGGVAGLGAAYKIRRAADAGHDVEFVLLEKADRLGGKLATDFVEDPETGARFVVDGGSDSFLTDKPAVHRVAKSLGVFDEETGTLDDNKKTYIVKDGRLVEMPDGIMMFAPTKIMPMATTPLYSWPAKFRMAMDLVIPKKTVPQGMRNDETLESFVVRRMGRECLDRLAEPLVGGVNGSDPALMSLAATYPSLLEMEQTHGSLVKGFLAQRKKVEAMRKKYPPKPGQKKRTFFTSFNEGLQFLTDKIAEAAGLEGIRTSTGVAEIARRAEGGWRVTIDSGESIDADGVLVATEVWAAEKLARGADSAVADVLAQIPSSSSATVPIAFDASDFNRDMRWHGILSPAVEKRVVTGVTQSSAKWPNRAPEGRVLLRGFVGGPHNQAMLEKGDEEIVEAVRRNLVDLVGLRQDAKPLFARVYRWKGGMPQYTIGHLDRVEQIESLSSQIPGFALAGGGYRGVGVPNCLESGEAGVSKILGDLGITLEEDSAEQKRIY